MNDESDVSEPAPFVPPPFACEDATFIGRRLREIQCDREIAECYARMERGREAPPAKYNTGFMVYQGPPT